MTLNNIKSHLLRGIKQVLDYSGNYGMREGLDFIEESRIRLVNYSNFVTAFAGILIFLHAVYTKGFQPIVLFNLTYAFPFVAILYFIKKGKVKTSAIIHFAYVETMVFIKIYYEFPHAGIEYYILPVFAFSMFFFDRLPMLLFLLFWHIAYIYMTLWVPGMTAPYYIENRFAPLGVVSGIFSIVCYFKYINRKYQRIVESQRQEALQDKASIQLQAEQLENMDKLKMRWFMNINHDLKTPLTIISFVFNQLKSSVAYEKFKDVRRLVISGNRNTKQIAHLLEDIQQLDAISNKKPVLRLEVIDLNKYVSDFVDAFVQLTQSRQIALHTNAREKLLSNNIIPVALDSNRFERVLTNLLSNALKFTESGGKISIIIEHDEAQQEVVLCVTDNGKGIDAAHIPYIFDRFYQSASDDFYHKEGAGIGLSIVKEIVEAHKGTITVKSQPAIGTSFYITLPVSSIRILANRSSLISDFVIERSKERVRNYISPMLLTEESVLVPANRSMHDGQSARSILVVDDHPELRHYMNELLNSHYTVHLARNGVEALKMLASKKIDLMIADLMMPKMDGFDLLSSIKRNDSYAQTLKVIILSADTSEKSRKTIISYGFSTILSKPFDAEELMLRIAQALTETPVAPNSIDMVSLHEQQKPKDSVKTQFDRYIERHIARSNLKVEEMAADFAMSERQFYRYIKDETGMTPIAYIKKVKLEKARSLLYYKQVGRVKDAAFAVGMNNITRFTNEFTKVYKETPEEVLNRLEN